MRLEKILKRSHLVHPLLFKVCQAFKEKSSIPYLVLTEYFVELFLSGCQ